MSIVELIDKIKRFLQSDVSQTVIDTGIAIAGTQGVTGAAAATVGTAINDLMKASDEFALQLLLGELASEYKSQEIAVNKLSNYVDSPRRALCVKDAILKARMTNAPLVAMILGIVLSEHVKKNSDYDDIDLIISQALDSAVDSDIRNFYVLMRKYIEESEDDFTPTEEEIEKYSFTLNWAESSRIIDHASGRFDDDDEIKGIRFSLDGYYAINDCTRRLYKYCERIRQKILMV